MDDKPYKVYDREGGVVLQATETCRYDKGTEQSLLQNGYTIRLGGKKITKKEVANRER